MENAKNNFFLVKNFQKPQVPSSGGRGSWNSVNSTDSRDGFLKIIPIGIPTYVGMKTGF